MRRKRGTRRRRDRHHPAGGADQDARSAPCRVDGCPAVDAAAPGLDGVGAKGPDSRDGPMPAPREILTTPPAAVGEAPQVDRGSLDTVESSTAQAQGSDWPRV